MPSSKLIPVIYQDHANRLYLKCYVDTLIYEKTVENAGKLLGIRFGGYPEQVRGMSDAIYGGGTLLAEWPALPALRLASLTKQYTRQQSMDGIYAEAVLFAQDDSDTPIPIADDENEGQTKLETPARSCYIFTPPDDKNHLFDEIDSRVRVPLIPSFRDYLLEELIGTRSLTRLSVITRNDKFDAWRLTCTADDGNMIQIVERGLKNGKIEIPGATPENSAVFDEIKTVSGYLREFGVTIAGRSKDMFVPLFDPSKEPVSEQVLQVNENISQWEDIPTHTVIKEGTAKMVCQTAPTNAALCGGAISRKCILSGMLMIFASFAGNGATL